MHHGLKIQNSEFLIGCGSFNPCNPCSIKTTQEFLARESISRPALDYSEGMTAEEQKRYINYLAERVNAADLENRAMKLVLQDFLDEKKCLAERLSKLDAVLSDVEDLKKSLASEVKRRKAAERRVDDLKAKLKFANKNRFGDKSHRTRKSESEEESDRTKDKDDFDGTSSSLPENSIVNKEPEASASTAPQEKKPRDLSNRPDTYKTMGIQGTAKEYKSDLSKVPGRILERKYATGQNRIGNMPKFSINECNEKLFKLPNAENLSNS